MNDQVHVGLCTSTENNYSQAGAEINVQIGTSLEANTKYDDGNVHANVEFFDGVHVEAKGAVEVSAPGGCGASMTGGVYFTDGTLLSAEITAGKNGVDASGEVAIGTAVGANAEVTADMRYASGTVGGGVSAGQQLSAGGGATATYNNDSVTLGLSGDVAAAVGIEVDVAVTADFGNAIDDGKYIADAAPGTISSIYKDVSDGIKSTSKTISNTAKKTGKKIKKAFKF
jgi:hypothetical protein